jgi:hypothetical protein
MCVCVVLLQRALAATKTTRKGGDSVVCHEPCAFKKRKEKWQKVRKDTAGDNRGKKITWQLTVIKSLFVETTTVGASSPPSRSLSSCQTMARKAAASDAASAPRRSNRLLGKYQPENPVKKPKRAPKLPKAAVDDQAPESGKDATAHKDNAQVDEQDSADKPAEEVKPSNEEVTQTEEKPEGAADEGNDVAQGGDGTKEKTRRGKKRPPESKNEPPPHSSKRVYQLGSCGL